MAANRQRVPDQFYGLRRYITGILVVCIIVTVVASGMAGASVLTICLRGILVWFGFVLARWAIIKTWGTLDEVRRAAAQAAGNVKKN